MAHLRTWLRQPFGADRPALAGGLLAAVSFGTMVLLRRGDPLQLLLLVPLGVGFALMLRGYVRQQRQRAQLDLLFDSLKEVTSATELEMTIHQLLSAARRLLHAEYAEIVLLPTAPGEPLVVSVSGHRREILMRPVLPSAADEIVLATMERADGSPIVVHASRSRALDRVLADRRIKDAIIGGLSGETREIGVLVVGSRAEGSPPFGEDDVPAFATFAGHASVVLQNRRLEQSLERLTELKDQLRHQAFHDALTGLANRVLFTEGVAAALESSGPDVGPSVLFLDLDDFKLVNDTWGHAAGDELLVHAAERLRHAVRPTDLPARLGGDEFAVLLAQSDLVGAQTAAQRIAAVFEEPFSVQSRTLSVRPSIGIAVAQPGISAEQLLQNADVAMYAAKVDDDVRVALYEPEMHASARRKRDLELELDEAIGRYEIEAHFQPLVSLADGSIEAFEALVRWAHPVHGLMIPADFIPIADSRQMAAIGKIVVAEACKQATLWQDAAAPRRVGVWVNLSAVELASDFLVGDVQRALKHSGLDPTLLTVEITEESVIKDEETAMRRMRALRELGVRVAIDDFGIGYSSLSHLGEFPLDTLKIPKSFVDRLVDETADKSLVDATLGLAASLGLDAVAKGVERDAQADALRQLGCAHAQGFLYAPALDRDFVLRLLRSGITLPAPHGFRTATLVRTDKTAQRRTA